MKTDSDSPTKSFAEDTQLNWLVRYLPLKPHLDSAARRSLLDLGCGPRGIATVVDDVFVGVDIMFPFPPSPTMRAFAYGGHRIPFHDRAFDTALSIDSLEHVPPAQRHRYLRELTRVAARQVLLAFPIDLANHDGTAFLANFFRRRGEEPPGWLYEHAELGLPDPADVEALLDTLPGWRWRALPAGAALMNLAFVLLDLMPEARSWVLPMLRDHPRELEAWIQAGSFGPSGARLYLLERTEPSTPLVDMSEPSTLVAATRCAECGGAVAGAPSLVLGCVQCGRVFSRNDWGVMEYKPTPVSFVVAGASVESPELLSVTERYLDAFGADEPCRLWVQTLPGQAEATMERLRPVFNRWSGRQFPEIVFSDGDECEGPGRIVKVPESPEAMSECTMSWFQRFLGGGRYSGDQLH